MLNLMLSLLGTYALICFGAWVLHRYFLYMPDKKRYAPKDVGLAEVEEITFEGRGGVKLIAWYLPARRGKPITREYAFEQRQTVVLAYERLASEGYVRARTGSGTDVTDAFRHYLRPLLDSAMPEASRLRARSGPAPAIATSCGTLRRSSARPRCSPT